MIRIFLREVAALASIGFFLAMVGMWAGVFAGV